jgi:enoyl-CoA hydratase/carnithine racemase/sugar lactone lactonase YvrE
VAVLRVDRPQALGALSRSMLQALNGYFKALRADEQTRVLVLTGTGRGFIAGADIGEYHNTSQAAFDDYQRLGRDTYDTLAALPQVTIAAVNGYALGGGFEVALCCDLIVAAEKARFGLPEISLGLLPGGGGTQRLARAAGTRLAKEAVLTGRMFTAEELARHGLLSGVYPAAELHERALDLARGLAGKAPLALRAAKRLVDDGVEMPLGVALTAEQQVLSGLFATGDAKEGISAFVEKRAPRFTGGAAAPAGRLPREAVSVLVDGQLTDPRIEHPEGVAVHPADGSVWCGGEHGQIYRIDPDGGRTRLVAETGGFCLGLAFDGPDRLYVCDLRHATVFLLDTTTGELSVFSRGVEGHAFAVPNFPVVDAEGRVYVSDSGVAGIPGPGIVRLEPDGTGELWHPGPFDFANGMAFAPDGRTLYLAETWRSAVVAIGIGADGRPSGTEDVALLPGVLPDGLAVGRDGTIYVGCYEPSQIMTIDPGSGAARVLFRDETAHLLCHPTNVALRGTELITANLGRWHLTRLDLSSLS